MNSFAASPLYDRNGNQFAHYFPGQRRSSIRRSNGRLLAVTLDDAVFAVDGRQIGWLIMGNLYDREGHLVLIGEGGVAGVAERTSREPQDAEEEGERMHVTRRVTLTGLWSPLQETAFFAPKPAAARRNKRKSLRSA